MGGLCSKEGADPYSTPGRTLGGGSTASPAQQPQRAKIPQQPKVTGQGRQLSGTAGQPTDARNAAALAAQARQEHASKPKGKLGEQLAAQKSGNALLKASEQERAIRDVDAQRETLAYN